MRLLDERDAFGGRLKAAVFLLHPGPSLLVTAVTVGAAAISLHAGPSPSLALRLVLLMLPAQFAIGAANDLADRGDDRIGKPHKPLVQGRASPRLAWLVVVAGALCSVGAAATLGPATLIAAVIGLGSGLAYDAGVKRTEWAVAVWWIAFSALPFCAFSAAGHVPVALWACIPLAAPLALALHIANALPDAEHDAERGIRSLPVRLGRRAGVAAAACAALTVAAAGLAAPILGQTIPWWGVIAAILLLAAAAGMLLPKGRGRPAVAPFPPLAAAAALFALAWLAALPW